MLRISNCIPPIPLSPIHTTFETQVIIDWNFIMPLPAEYWLNAM